MPCHVSDMCPVIGLNTLESGSDSELSTQSARMITINEACGDPLEVNNAYAMESSKEEVPLPRRSARRKRPTPGCHLYDHQITGREGVEKLKGRTCRLLLPMSQRGFVVQRDNKRCAVYAGGTADVYMNPATVPGWIKTGGELNK